MKKTIQLLSFFAVLIWSAAFSESIDQFDVACQIFTEAKNTGFDKEQRSAYVEENLKSRISSKVVLDTYFIVFHLQPEERYAAFKQTAERHLHRSWKCDAARELFQKPKGSE